MELDQSDIKQLLSNVSSLRTSEFKAIFGPSPSSNNTICTNNNCKSVGPTPVSTAPGSVYSGSIHSAHSAPSSATGIEQQQSISGPHSVLVTPTSAPTQTTTAYDAGSTTRSITSSEASFGGSAMGVSASASVSNGTGAGSAAFSHHLHHQSKKSNRDIENIIVEAGELWRKFAYMESIEEEDED
ncbi:unnamed protein product [Ambrosiozyma monospora]|uniref:Unnamed protein product n=1 Tax=Ambrosiozyma monospora TaxID=43982 RepID=A0ACB5TNZ5_AMBMO|nr:unnamed protein product [Ambrosiozyma monospora]